MEIDKKLFEFINSYQLPELVTDISIYVHGFKHVEVAFFLFCLILAGVVLGSPKKGMRASMAVFIAAMASFFGAGYLQTIFSRPFPYLNDTVVCQLRVEPLANLSAFPLVSVTLASAVAVSLIYYFPKYSLLVVVGSIIYALMPVHLGVAFPSDSFGSLLIGYVFSYFLMNLLGKKTYFKRF